MLPDHDPLWYDRAEPDEPLGAFAGALIGAFAVLEFICVGGVSLFRLLKGGIALALRDAKP